MSATPAAMLLERLPNAREVGLRRWRAPCPAHQSKAPTLSIRETDCGAVLLHCFRGCSAQEVVAAIGLELHDLFPREPETHATRPRRLRVDWLAAMVALEKDLILVRVLLADIAAGRTLPQADRDAASAAAGRMLDLLEEIRT